MVLRVFLSFLIIFTASIGANADTIDTAKIDARLERLMKERGMVGLAVAIIDGGELVHVKGYGETLAGTGDKVTDETVFRWASVSKSVAATMVAKLDEQGRLSLSDPAALHAKSLRLPNRGESQATVQNVLSHQLGIIRNAYDNRLEAGGNPFEIRADLASLPEQCPVGTCHGYQNVAFDASSEMVEAVTSKAYAQAAKDELFTPLGMTSVVMDREGLQHSVRWARPHNRSGFNVYRRMRDSYFKVPAAGGISSNIRDLGLWVRAQMGQTPEILSQSVLDETQTPRVITPRERNRVNRFFPAMSDAQYGLGWRVYDYAGHKVVGHRGAVNGYRAMVLFDPEAQVGVAALWNSGSNQPVGLQMEIMDMAYGRKAQDWLYLDGGPNLRAVRLANKVGVSIPDLAPTPRLSPFQTDDGLPAEHGAPLFTVEHCFAF